MKTPKILALILAGGKGARLEILTEQRAKPVMPFGGIYRLIDFALSNCLHSQISDVWVVEQYELHSLNEHLANGRPWDLDRTYGGLLVLPPNQLDDKADDTGGFATGNADAIFRHGNHIRGFNPDILIVLSADHVYKLDFREVVAAHLDKNADVTMVTTKVPANESASRFGVVKVNEDGQILHFDYKPEQPESDLITTEVFVYDAKRLLDTLDELSKKDGSLKDFGHELIPHLVEAGRAFEFRFDGYWRDVGTVAAYWRANMDLLDEKLEMVLDEPGWAILTQTEQRVPAFVFSTAEVRNSLIAHGSRVRGLVTRSILASGVIVEENAEISDSIVLQNAVIKSGAVVRGAIVDANAEIGANAVVGLPDKLATGTSLTNEEITLIGQSVKIPDNSKIEQGARVSKNDER